MGKIKRFLKAILLTLVIHLKILTIVVFVFPIYCALLILVAVIHFDYKAAIYVEKEFGVLRSVNAKDYKIEMSRIWRGVL